MGGAGIAAVPGCWALTPVHSQSTSGRGGVHTVVSKSNRTCLSAHSCCSTARLEHSPCPAMLCLSPPPALLLHSLPRASTARWPDQALPASQLWCVGHGVDGLRLVPPESSSTPLLPGRAWRVSSDSDPHTWGLSATEAWGAERERWSFLTSS